MNDQVDTSNTNKENDPKGKAKVESHFKRSYSFMEASFIKSVQSRWRLAVLICVLAVISNWLPALLYGNSSKSTFNFQVDGHVHPAFTEVVDVFRENLRSGKEQGASFSVYYKGQALVDLWGGLADPLTGALWKEDTLSQAWSCTKGLAAVAVATLVDRDLLNYDKPVKTYWPEFAQNGKENITVGMLISHRAGLVSLGRRITLHEYRDNWPDVLEMLANQTPAWEPGHHYMYHAFTFGMYVDALVRIVDPQHRNISQFVKEEIAIPLDLDYHVGLPAEQQHRSTRAEYVSMLRLFMSTVVLRPDRWKWLPEIFMRSRFQDAVSVLDIYDNMAAMEDPELRTIGLASMVGFGNARSLAKFYDFLGNNGTVKGKRLLSEKCVTALATPATTGVPSIVAPDFHFTMGLIDFDICGHRVFGHNGYGGQGGFADRGSGLGVGYVTNFNSEYADAIDPRLFDLMQAVYNNFQKFQLSEEKSILNKN